MGALGATSGGGGLRRRGDVRLGGGAALRFDVLGQRLHLGQPVRRTGKQVDLEVELGHLLIEALQGELADLSGQRRCGGTGGRELGLQVCDVPLGSLGGVPRPRLVVGADPLVAQGARVGMVRRAAHLAGLTVLQVRGQASDHGVDAGDP